MDSEIIKQLQMTYQEQCEYLQQKYGLPEYDYFTNELCRSKPNISRTSEGLFVHHNAEVLEGVSNLNRPELARRFPFEYQKRENLSYCNYIEHLLFHLKINAKSCSVFEFPYEFRYFFVSYGFFWICWEINNLFKEGGSSLKWQNDCFSAIKNIFSDYIGILKGVICFLENNFVGDKSIVLTEGAKLCLSCPKPGGFLNHLNANKERNNIKYHSIKIGLIIKNVVPEDNRVEMILQYNITKDGLNILNMHYGNKLGINNHNGVYEANLSTLQNLFNYHDQIDYYKKQLCLIYNKTDSMVWTDLMSEMLKPYTEQDKTVADLIKNAI